MLKVVLTAASLQVAAAVVVQRLGRNATATGPCAPADFEGKDLDVVLFGATGTLGLVFTEYMAKRNTHTLRWALGGRNMEALKDLHTKFGLKAPKLVQADYERPSTLAALAKRSKVVLNLAGPYEPNKAGRLVKASLENCAHYVDVAGETHWRSDILKKLGPLAKERGLILSQGAGHVSLFADWLALSAARDVASDGNGPPDDVFITFHKMNGAPGGGSLASASYAYEKYGPILDPYILSPETPGIARIDQEIDGVDKFGFHPGVNYSLGVYAGARMDCPVARRTMHEEFPGMPIKVHEARTPELFDKLKTFMEDPRTALEPPPMMPAAHRGIARWMMDEGSFAAEAWSVRKKDGRAARVKMHGKGDPAFMGSAKMTSELAILLATKGPYKGRTGYISPAQVVDTAELEGAWKAIDDGEWAKITHLVEHVNPARRGTKKSETSEDEGAPNDEDKASPSDEDAESDPPAGAPSDEDEASPGDEDAASDPLAAASLPGAGYAVPADAAGVAASGAAFAAALPDPSTDVIGGFADA